MLGWVSAVWASAVWAPEASAQEELAREAWALGAWEWVVWELVSVPRKQPEPWSQFLGECRRQCWHGSCNNQCCSTSTPHNPLYIDAESSANSSQMWSIHCIPEM